MLLYIMLRTQVYGLSIEVKYVGDWCDPKKVAKASVSKLFTRDLIENDRNICIHEIVCPEIVD